MKLEELMEGGQMLELPVHKWKDKDKSDVMTLQNYVPGDSGVCRQV